jgi:hypothetical protein
MWKFNVNFKTNIIHNNQAMVDNKMRFFKGNKMDLPEKYKCQKPIN